MCNVAEFQHRHRAPLKAVGDDQPVRVFAADGLDQLADDRHVGLRLDLGRFVHQVEAQTLAGDASVAAGKHGPVPGTDALGLGVGPETGFLRRLGDRIARGTVEVERNVNPVLAAPRDGLVDLPECRLIECFPVCVLDPEAIVHGQTHEVEAESRDEPEILFQERLSPAGQIELFQQVEAAPTRQLVGARGKPLMLRRSFLGDNRCRGAGR